MLFSYPVILTLLCCYGCIVANAALQMLLTLFFCDVFIYPHSSHTYFRFWKKNSCIIHPYFHMLRLGYSKTQVQYIKTCSLQTNFWNKFTIPGDHAVICPWQKATWKIEIAFCLILKFLYKNIGRLAMREWGLCLWENGHAWAHLT